MHTSDHSNFFKFICDLPNQIEKAPTFLKNLNLEKVRQMIEISDKLNILCHGFFMLGFPSETEEEMILFFLCPDGTTSQN